MSQPSPYARDYDFEGFQSGHPSTPLPGDKVNAELDAVNTAIEAILTNLALIQRDDTAVANKSIGWDQLKDELRHGFTTPTEWATGTVYEAGDQVYFGRKVYAAKVGHTSGTFSIDYNAGDWLLLADFTPITEVDQSAQESAADAANSAAEAATSAATATTKATAASTSETNAAASAAAAAADAAELAVWSATYDPNNVAGDAFDMDNMVEGADTKIMTAAERTKLAHITVAADIDLGDAVLNTATDASGYGFVVDEDDMASDSATKLPTQQSVKAYADLKLARASNLSDVADAVAAQDNLNYQRTPGDSTFAILSSVNKMSQRADVRDWDGIDLTGTNDSTTALQAAFTASQGFILHSPGGIIVTESAITVPCGAVFEGVSPAVGHYPTLVDDRQTWFHLAHTGKGFIITGDNSSNPATVMRRFATVRDQPAPSGGSFTPDLTLDYDIFCAAASDIYIDEWHMQNPTNGFLVQASADGGSNRINLGRITGQPLGNGIRMEYCYDVNRLNNIHFWPFWNVADEVLTYTMQNAVAMMTGRIDNPQIDSFFSFAYRFGWQFIASADNPFGGFAPGGVTGNFQAGMIQFDAGSAGLFINSGVDGVTGNIDNMVAYGTSSPVTSNEARGFYMFGDDADIGIGQLKVDYAGGAHGSIAGTGNRVRVGKLTAKRHNQNSIGAKMFDVGPGNYLDIDGRINHDTTVAELFSGTGVISADVWRDFTTSVSSGTGTITTVGATSLKYRRIGDTVEWKASIAITTNGTGATDVRFTLPFAPAAASTGYGRETAIDGRGLTVAIAATSTTAVITRADSTYPAADGSVLNVSGRFEV